MSKAEVMLVMILFHDSGYRCLKHFYVDKVCKHLRHLFPKGVSCNRFVELEREVAISLTLFIKKFFRQVYSHQFRGQHPFACLQESVDSYSQGIQGYCPKR